MRKLVFWIVLVATSTTGTSIACSFPPRVPEGFINAGFGGQHLPANARGAVFWVAGASYYWLRNGSLPNTYFVVDVPNRLDTRDFEITEQSGNQKLGVAIEPIPASSSKTRYLMATKPSLARCIRENLFSLDGCIPLENDAPGLVAQGAFRDVTDDVQHAYGLFRIAPSAGFVPDRKYRIRFKVAPPKHIPFAYPAEILLNIDPSRVHSWPTNALQLRVSRTPRDIQPGEEKAVYVDDQLARDLRPYRQSIHLSGTVTPPLRQPLFPSCGFQTPLSTGKAFPLRFVGGTCHQVQATARFLELADDAATSAKVGVNCPVR